MRAGEKIEISSDYELLPRAARGDVQALRELAITGITLFRVNNDAFALMEGLAFARLAAAIGDEGEAGLLMAALACVSEYAHEHPEHSEWADSADAELLSIAARLADAGAPQADQMLLGLSASTSANAAVLAKELAPFVPLMGGIV